MLSKKSLDNQKLFRRDYRRRSSAFSETLINKNWRKPAALLIIVYQRHGTRHFFYGMKNQGKIRTLVLAGCFLDQQKARDIPGPGFLIHMFDLDFYLLLFYHSFLVSIYTHSITRILSPYRHNEKRKYIYSHNDCSCSPIKDS